MKRFYHIFKFFAAMLVVAAMFSCSKADQPVIEDDPVVEEEKPVAPVARIIHYSVNVKNGGSSTKATISGEKSQVFETGDVLRITGEEISGDLTLVSGAGSQSAVFSGDLEYEGEGDPADDLLLSATLISTSDVLNSGGNYNTAVVSSLGEAVQKYSSLTGESTYAQKSFNLSQGSTFVSFKIISSGLNGLYTITLSDENNNSASNTINISKGNAFFAIAFPGGTVLKNALITITDAGDNVVWTRKFGGANTSLGTGKLSTVTDKIKVGDVFYSDGTWGNYKQQTVSSTRVALGLVVYVNEGENSKHPSFMTSSDDIISFANGITEESNGYGHALVMAFNDCSPANGGVRWTTENKKRINNSAFEQEWFNNLSASRRDELMFLSYNGIGKTEFMKASPAIYLAAACISEYTPAVDTTHSSNWFMPTISQWIASFLGLGECASFLPVLKTSTHQDVKDYNYYPTDGDFYYSEDIYDKFYSYVGTASYSMPINICSLNGWTYQDVNGRNYNWNYYWSSTQMSAERVLCTGFRDGEGVKGVVLAHHVKDRQDTNISMYGRQVRAFLAF
ncbi:MAG: hypothetical protein J6X91_06400 [Bacteroidales bacterium]|nr:hypothetical protein [Bacteroidales bacterium]